VGEFSYEFAGLVWGSADDQIEFEGNLDQLLQASLVSYDQAAGTYSIAAPLRLFLLKSLESSASAREIKERYCHGVFDSAVATKTLTEAHKDAEAFRLLDHYNADLENAIRLAIDLHEVSSKLPSLLSVLPLYWVSRNRLSDIDVLLRSVIDKVHLESVDRAAFLNIIGASHLARRDYAGAADYFFEIVALLQAAGETKGLFRAYGNLGLIYHERREFVPCTEYHARAVLAARSEAEPAALVSVLLNYAASLEFWLHTSPNLCERGKWLHQVETCVEEAEPIARRLKHLVFIQSVYHVRGELHLLQGDGDTAARYFVKAALVCELGGLTHEASQAMDRLCGHAIERRAYERAAKLMGAAIALRIDNTRCRSDYEEEVFLQMRAVLAESLGARRLNELMQYGASLAICDLCVLTDVPHDEALI
jgi:tetratricopeptide (TPR) repeat protein